MTTPKRAMHWSNDIISLPSLDSFHLHGFYIIGGSQSLRRGLTAYRYGSTSSVLSSSYNIGKADKEIIRHFVACRTFGEKFCRLCFLPIHGIMRC